jgi:putative restriction endonuclease
MTRRNWSREEVLAAFNLYCRTPFGRLHARNPEIISLAGTIGRTPDAVAMKCCNLASLDSSLRARGIAGLSGASRLDQEIWNEFNRDAEAVGYQSEVAYAALTHSKPRATDDVEWEDVQGLDKTVVTKVRVNQHLFRSIILAGYRFECAVCALPIPSLLVAAHIVPWSADKSQRMNPRNGICLCSLHDKAFDTGILTVGEDFHISVDTRIAQRHTNNLAVECFLLKYSGQVISLPDRWGPDPDLLRRHSQLVEPPTASVV